MRITIPWEEVRAEWAKEPGYAEAYAQAKHEFEAELAAEVAKYGTIANPKPTQRTRSLFARPKTKRTPRPAIHRKAVEA